MKNKPKVEQCSICRLPIYITKDNYCQLIDFHKGKFFTEGFYHTNCYTEKLKGAKESEALRKAAWGMLKKVQGLTGEESKEEFVIG